MAPRRQQADQQQNQRAVVRASSEEQLPPGGPQAALVAVRREIDNRLAIIGASAAAGIKAERLTLVALTAFTRSPKLWTCDPISVARSIVEAGQLGLEPTGLLGGAYLVPRKDQCTLLIGYRGLVMLAKRSGEVQRVESRVVREKDTFDYGYGLEPFMVHQPSRDVDPGPLTYAYAVMVYRDGERQFDVMSKAEIEDIRKRSATPDAGPWVTDYFEMAKKTPLRRLMKMAPLTIEVAAKLDELDPEVVDHAPAKDDAAAREQAKLRAQLQVELDREYGGGVEEGQFRDPDQPAATTQGSGSPAAQAPAAGHPPGDQAADVAQQAAPPGRRGAGGAPAAQPESVGQVLGQQPTCGATHQGLGVGPCVLPPHQQNEHQDASGTRYSMPKGGA